MVRKDSQFAIRNSQFAIRHNKRECASYTYMSAALAKLQQAIEQTSKLRQAKVYGCCCQVQKCLQWHYERASQDLALGLMMIVVVVVVQLNFNGFDCSKSASLNKISASKLVKHDQCAFRHTKIHSLDGLYCKLQQYLMTKIIMSDDLYSFSKIRTNKRARMHAIFRTQKQDVWFACKIPLELSLAN